jgi:DNA-binding protein H-NS
MGRGPNLAEVSQPIALRTFFGHFQLCFAAKPLSHVIITRCEQEATMAKLTGMTIEALIDLRERVEEALLKRRAELRRQIERIAGPHAVVRGRGGGSVLKGKKVPPKYRGPSGETWAGRGARPRWLVTAIKGGKKLDDFLIDKSARKGRKKLRAKR